MTARSVADADIADREAARNKSWVGIGSAYVGKVLEPIGKFVGAATGVSRAVSAAKVAAAAKEGAKRPINHFH
jgi:hypothetical protein